MVGTAAWRDEIVDCYVWTISSMLFLIACLFGLWSFDVHPDNQSHFPFNLCAFLVVQCAPASKDVKAW